MFLQMAPSVSPTAIGELSRSRRDQAPVPRRRITLPATRPNDPAVFAAPQIADPAHGHPLTGEQCRDEFNHQRLRERSTFRLLAFKGLPTSWHGPVCTDRRRADCPS